MGNSLRLIDFLLALSESLDLFSPVLAKHQIKTALIALKIAEELNISSESLENVVSTALIHDIGALNPEEKLALKENRFESNIDQHCIKGENLLNSAPVLERHGEIIRNHHLHWKDRDIVDDPSLLMEAQIISVADTVERFIDKKQYILHQSEQLRKRIVSQSGVVFDPDIVEGFLSISSRDSFWFDIAFNSTANIIRNHPVLSRSKIPDSQLIGISEVLRSIVDFRSHFTATHSTGVSSAASIIADILGLSREENKILKVAGNLHDIGKITISTRILQKPDKLSFLENREMRQHPYHTYLILQKCGFSKEIVEAASYHHEKINGSGYPFHLKGNDLTKGARIIAVADILTALAEDRPYRKGMNQKEILKVLDEDVKIGSIDGDIVALIKSNYEDIVNPAIDKQVSMSRIYMEKFKAA